MSSDNFTRGTTPIIKLQIVDPEDFDMDNISICHLTIEQPSTGISLLFDDPDIDIENKIISVHLTQEQSLKFGTGIVEVQIKALLKDGNTCACDIIKGTIDRILEETVL